MTIDLIDALQWPAMAITLLASWLVTSKQSRKRKWGFAAFVLSNALWIAWGWPAGATALVVLQCCLGVTNVRGMFKNDD